MKNSKDQIVLVKNFINNKRTFWGGISNINRTEPLPLNDKNDFYYGDDNHKNIYICVVANNKEDISFKPPELAFSIRSTSNGPNTYYNHITIQDFPPSYAIQSLNSTKSFFFKDDGGIEIYWMNGSTWTLISFIEPFKEQTYKYTMNDKLGESGRVDFKIKMKTINSPKQEFKDNTYAIFKSWSSNKGKYKLVESSYNGSANETPNNNDFYLILNGGASTQQIWIHHNFLGMYEFNIK